MERAARKESCKQLQELHTIEVSRLQDAVYQLKQENSSMKVIVNDLQRRPTRPFAAAQGHDEPDAAASHTFGSHFHHHHSTTAGHGAMLIDRVVQLEETVSKQQIQIEDRGQRLMASIKDTLEAKVDIEVERTRSIAREVAKASAEDLISIRLTSLSSAFGKQVLDVEHMCASTSSRADDLSKRISAFEEALRTQDHRIELITAASSHGNKSHNELKEEVVKEAESRMELERQRIEAAMSQLRSEVSSQMRKQSSESIQSQQVLQQYIAQRMDTLSAQGVLRDEVQRMISQATGSVEGEIASIVRSQTAMKQLSDDSRQELTKRMAQAEQKVQEQKEIVQTLVSKEANSSIKLQRVVQDAEELRGKASALVQEVEALRATAVDQSSAIESHRQQTEHHGASLVRLEQDIATSSAKSNAAIKASDRAETSLGQIESKLEHESADRLHQVSKLNEQLAALQRDVKRASGEIKMLTERAEQQSRAGGGGSAGSGDGEAVAPVRQAVAGLERRLADLEEQCKGTFATQEEMNVEVQAKLEGVAKATALKQLDVKITERVVGIETKVDESLETVTADRRRDYEQLQNRLQELGKRVGEVRAEAEDRARSITDSNYELQTTLHKALNDKCAKSTVNELDQRLTALESDHNARLEAMEDLGPRVSELQGKVAALATSSSRHTSPTPSARAPSTAGHFGAKDAQRLIDEALGENLTPALESLREDCTENATKVSAVSKHVGDLQARLRHVESGLQAAIERTELVAKELSDAANGGAIGEGAVGLPEEHIAEIQQQIENNRYLLETQQSNLNQLIDTVTVHGNYFEEVKERIEDLSAVDANAVATLRGLISQSRQANDGTDNDKVELPTSVAECLALLWRIQVDYDQRFQLNTARVVSVLSAHSALLPELVSVSNTYSNFFQLFASHCGLEPADFVVELTHDAAGGEDGGAHFDGEGEEDEDDGGQPGRSAAPPPATDSSFDDEDF